MVRTGYTQEALHEVLQSHQAIEHREASFAGLFKAWVESTDRRYVKRSSDEVPFAERTMQTAETPSRPAALDIQRAYAALVHRRSLQASALQAHGYHLGSWLTCG